MKRTYARLIGPEQENALQTAAEDVGFLTAEGMTPTDAIVKVASAAQFPAPMTDLLIYAYSNGMAAEKRASDGGPFERLAEFEIPDPAEIHRRVYSVDVADKTASAGRSPLPNGMKTFEKSLEGMDPDQIRRWVGLPDIKTAGNDSPLFFSGTSCTRFTLPKEQVDTPIVDDSEKPFQQRLREKTGGMVDESELDDLHVSLVRLMGAKKEAMIAANAEADAAYANLQSELNAIGRKVRNPALEPAFKRAGLLSVNNYYPEVGKLLSTCVDEVTGYQIKSASHTHLDITINHPWVKDAEHLNDQIEKTADLTMDANQKSEQYRIACEMYANRDKIHKYAASAAVPFIFGDVLRPISRASMGLYGKPDEEEKRKKRKEVTDDLDDPLHELNLRDIQLQNVINDFAVNDEILSSYPVHELLHGYNSLLHTAPGAMRDEIQARSLLQQYMTQGRMAPSEVIPALQLNKLSPRKDTFVREKRKEGRDE